MATTDPADYTAGSIDKNKKYPRDLKNNIKRRPLLKEKHPLYNGIVMQAHHLISTKGAKMSELDNRLVKLGYEINVVKNLVFLPSTLEGACHLKVQLHRSDHKGVIDGKNYHRFVSDQIKKLKRKMNDCKSNAGKSSPMQRSMDLKSKLILNAIAQFKIPLTHIYKNFESDNTVGCCNKNNIPAVRRSITQEDCTSNRNHHGQQHSFSAKSTKKSTIMTNAQSYKLKVGQ